MLAVCLQPQPRRDGGVRAADQRCAPGGRAGERALAAAVTALPGTKLDLVRAGIDVVLGR